DAEATALAGDRQQGPDLDRLARRPRQAAERAAATARGLGPTTAAALLVRAAGGRQHERTQHGHEGHPPWPTHRHSLLLTMHPGREALCGVDNHKPSPCTRTVHQDAHLEREAPPMPSGEDRRPLLLGAADVATLFDLDTGLASQREAFT